MTYYLEEQVKHWIKQLQGQVDNAIIEALPEETKSETPMMVWPRLSCVVDCFGWSTYSYNGKPLIKIGPLEPSFVDEDLMGSFTTKMTISRKIVKL